MTPISNGSAAEVRSAQAASEQSRHLNWRDTKTVEEQRNSLFNEHPVVRWDEDFCMPTDMLIKASEIVSQSIYLRRSGRAFFASPRYGKTTAINFLTRRIQETYKDVPVFCTEATPSMRPTELGLYGDLLDCSQYSIKPAKLARDRRAQLVNVWWSAAKTRGENRIVLFIDEAQSYTEHEWSWLKTVQNLLRKERIALIVFPFGQEDLVHERNALTASGRVDLCKRFLRNMFRFNGIASPEALHEFLRVFDEEAHYPGPDGPVYSRFFFPRAFEAGWRLASESRQAWESIVRSGLLGSSIDVGMEWIGISIRHFLTEFCEEDSVIWRGSTRHWNEAVAASDPADSSELNDTAKS